MNESLKEKIYVSYGDFIVSSILGHAQASTTLNLYGHALPDHKRASMEKMSGYYTSSFDTNSDIVLIEEKVPDAV